MANKNYESNLPNVKKAIKESRERALLAVGEFLKGEATLRCSAVKTSNLKGSIEYQYDIDKLEVQFGTNVEYAIYVEKGTGVYEADGKGRKTPWSYMDADGNWHRTSGMKPRPFITPAVEQNLTRVQELFERYMRLDDE